jgi:succinate dehydrogenase / fumarate reductase flavoprotein subunit
MQGLADGYFILPATVPDYLARTKLDRVDAGHPAVRQAEAEAQERTARLLAIKGKRTVDALHRELGHLLWEHCGMARNEAGLRKALERIPALREEFWKNVLVVDGSEEVNPSLEKAGRVADFLELAELLCLDARHRHESCGGHFREESQTADGEAKRDDANFSYVAAWEHTGDLAKPALHKEPLTFEHIHLAERSYK